MEIKLKPGNYWFYGYDDKEAAQKAKFNRFLKCLKETYLIDDRGYGFCTGHYTNSGIFHFTLQEKLIPTQLVWSSSLSSGDSSVKAIKKSHSRIRWEDPFFEEEHNSFLKIPKGITECSEKCVFYYMCDGNRESPLNPSSILPGVSCQNYNFSNITERYE